MKTTRWSPDTCGCVIDYSWDDSLPTDQITITPFAIVSVCTAHTAQASTNINTHFNTIIEENPRKNNALQHILDNGPTTLYDLNGTTKTLKNGIGFTFSWSGTAPNRVLTVSFTGITLTTAQKNTAQTALNNRFGAGKVVLA